MDKLSVIIPTLNEASYLPQLLRALRNQTRVPDEVIVADAGSVDGTAGFARASGVIVVPGGRPSVGRNAGAKAATGNIFLFLDADVLPAPDFIERALEKFTAAGGGVASCFIDTLNPSLINRLIIDLSNSCMWAVRRISPHAPGFCIFVDSKNYNLVGGFDESLLLSEDHDFVRRVSKYCTFHILAPVRIPVSFRRIEKEGLGMLMLKYLWCELHILINKPIRSLPFAYEFGTHDPLLANPKVSYTVRRLARRIWLILN
jgi:glycosyltransferase involved in cell wall biosynthesis